MDKRMYHLLRHAEYCFRHCMSPFSHEMLSKENVTANECKDLSVAIADIISEFLALSQLRISVGMIDVKKLEKE